MSSSTSDVLGDPSGVRAAIDRYRDLAKYLITIFAAIGGALVAGTQLSSLGALSWEHDSARIVVAAIGFVLALGSVAGVVASALAVLRPIELSLEAVGEADELREFVESRPRVLGGLRTVRELEDLLESDLLQAERRDEWVRVADDVVGRAAFYRVRQSFERAWRRMLVGGLIGTIGIVAFAWASNPPLVTDEACRSKSFLVDAGPGDADWECASRAGLS
jgi:hypothetical protein